MGQYSLDAQTKQINMGTSNSKSKNFDSEQVSQTEKPTLEEVFPIATNMQNPGYQLMLRNIFNYFKLENWFYSPEQVSRDKKAKSEDFFPIETFLQNPGYQLISRNIFKYLKLKDFSNCCLVSKGWKQFIDEDKYLANVQLTEVVSLYSKAKEKYVPGFTPFHFVCQSGSLRIVKLFLDNKKKIDIVVNAQDENGWTPLHCASNSNNSLVVKQLLNHGLNVTLRTKKNSNIIHLAALNKDPNVIQAVFESSQLRNIDKKSH